MRTNPNNSEPVFSREILLIARALAAANLVQRGIRPPSDHWKLTPELIDEAERALSEIGTYRRRVLFDR